MLFNHDGSWSRFQATLYKTLLVKDILLGDTPPHIKLPDVRMLHYGPGPHVGSLNSMRTFINEKESPVLVSKRQ